MNNLELLPPDDLQQHLRLQSEKIYSAITRLRAHLAKSPPGRIRMAHRGNGVRFYHVTDPKSPGGMYIPRCEESIVAKLIQKDYELSVLLEMERRLDLLNKFIAEYRPQVLGEIFAEMPELRRAFVTPVQFSDEEYAKRWLAVPYRGKPISADQPEFVTARGERVRSKSEVIIADTLSRMGIPYRYEFPLKLKLPRGKGITNFFPDFTCLNLRTREEYLWEHFGMMDDPDYAQKATAKLRLYEESGILPGRNLILTMESQKDPLSTRVIEKIIEGFLISA
jgi:hypothetical protein